MVESSDIDAGPLLSHAACWYAAATGPGGGAVGGGCVAGAREEGAGALVVVRGWCGARLLFSSVATPVIKKYRQSVSDRRRREAGREGSKPSL